MSNHPKGDDVVFVYPAFRHPDAACKDATDLFFPEKGDNGNKKAARARAACRTCKAFDACYQYVMEAPGNVTQAGIWAGTNLAEIRQARSKYKRGVAA